MCRCAKSTVSRKRPALPPRSIRSPASSCLQSAPTSPSPTRTYGSRRASRHRQGGAVESILWRRRGAALGDGNTRLAWLFSATSPSNYDPALAKELLAKSNFSPANPVKIGFATTNGQFPNDYDIARAMRRCGNRSVIEADVQVIEYAKYFELNRGGKLPEATLYSWDNSTGDPENLHSAIISIEMPFAPWKDDYFGNKDLALFGVADYDKRVVEYKDWSARR